MSFISRIIVVVVVIAFGLLVQTGLLAYLEAPGPIPPGELHGDLKGFPMALGDWVGQDVPLDESVRYQNPIEYVQRGYIHRVTKQIVYLWAVYSPVGEDRGHHPEVCLPVAGRPEDPNGKALVEVEGHESPVQQLRYGTGSPMTLVYYWHYTLPSEKKAELDGLQRWYHEHKQRSASMTLEVFADEKWPNTAAGAIEFVRLVDAAMQPIVGPDAQRGCDRLPVVMN